MLEKQNSPVKRGRPIDESKSDIILDVAAKLFMENGFYQTNMDEIAQHAQMSKLTLYSRFPDKQGLFRAVIERKCEHFLPPDIFEKFKDQSPPIFVKKFSESFMNLIMSDDAIRIYRMMMTEAGHRPDLSRIFYDSGPKRVKAMLDDTFLTFQKRKLIKNHDLIEMRDHLLSLFTGSEMYMKALLNIGKKPSHHEINKYVDQMSKVFIRAYL